MTFKHFWKNRKFKVWFCTAVPILVLVTAIVVAFTANAFLYQTLNSVFGGERQVLKSGDASKYVYYKGEYSDKKSVLKAANELNEEIAAEGAVLLKNEDNALPIAKNSKITVFGKNSVNPVLGGSGSNAASAGSGVIGIYDSLKNVGYEVNPEMRKFYEDNSRSGAGRPQSPGMNSTITGLTGFPTGETAVEKIDEKARSSWSAYSDAALVVVSRIGGEGFDLPRTMFWDGKDYQNWTSDTLIDGARKKDDHYLQLDKNETELLKTVAESFDKIIVVINSPTLLECGFLDDSGNYAFSEKIKAALFVGAPGNTGFNALGKILSGEVNPSGRLTDTAARDFKTDPTWNNFGNNLKDGGNRYTDENGSAKNAYFVNYSEGIYTGYRYWETRGFVEGEKEFSGTINNTETSVFDSWYEAHVVYPFGYGLSYTEFSWEVKPAENNAMTADGTLKFEVTVKNEGSTAGKEVVELYYTSPYAQGGIEKAHKVLGGFAKTGVIAPGETEKVTVEVSVRDMASYDYSDANKNGFKGYELESGEYVLCVAKNAHEDVKTYSYNLANDIKYETDSATNATIENLFDDVSGRIKTYMSRADFDGTFPALPTADEYKLSASDLSALNYKLADKETDPWYATKTPSFSSANLTLDQTTVKLYDLIGKDYNDEKWEELLSQLTVADVRKLIESGNYHTEPIECIDKPKTTDPDGPMGYSLFMGDPSVYDTCYYSSESLMGCTWNKELMERFGEMIGEESLVGNKKGDGRTYAGWYAPACNLHRSQFSGRNFEYYSEDGVLSSSLTVAVIKGAKKKGVYNYLKHFALNDQETNRDTSGLVVWANEQAMRENYFLPFEKAVKDGGTNAMMSAFNRIGFTWCGGNYTLLTTLLRDEWGFEGMVVTDYNLTAYMNVDQMIRAGGDINLSQSKSLKDVSSATALTAMRKAAKNILFTVANSNAMNGHGSGNVYGYAGPTWFTIMWASFAVVVSAVLTFGVFAVVSAVSGYRAGVKAGVIVVKQPEKQVVLGKKAKIFLPVTALIVAAVTVVSAILLSAPAVKPYVPELPAVEQGEITLSLNGSPISGEGVLVNKGSSGDIITVTVNSVGSSVGKVSFSSSNENVLTVSEKGILTAVDTGEAVITVSAQSSAISSSVLVKVIERAVDTEKTYGITISGGSADKKTAKKGEVINLTPETKKGYVFVGWQFSASVRSVGNTFVMPACDVSVTAAYAPETYVIKLDGATFEDGSASKKIAYGETLGKIKAEIPAGKLFLAVKDTDGVIYPLDYDKFDKNMTLSPAFTERGAAIASVGKSGFDTGSGTSALKSEAVTIDGFGGYAFTAPASTSLIRVKNGGIDGATYGKFYAFTFKNYSDEDLTFTYRLESYGKIYILAEVTVKAGETFAAYKYVDLSGLGMEGTPYSQIAFDKAPTSEFKLGVTTSLLV